MFTTRQNVYKCKVLDMVKFGLRVYRLQILGNRCKYTNNRALQTYLTLNYAIFAQNGSGGLLMAM